MLKVKDWIGPVLAILIPVGGAFIHLENSVARLEANVAALTSRVERIERWVDQQSRTAYEP